MLELHLTRMNNVAPHEQLVTGALHEVSCMSRRVTRLTERGNARNHLTILLDEHYLSRFEVWTYCCAGLFDLALESFRVILSVLSGHKIFDIAFIDIYGRVRELSDSADG